MLRAGCVVDLSGVGQLRQLARGDGAGLRIGAAVTARTLERDPGVRAAYSAIAESGALVGPVQIRNLATLGGNLCNAAPSADMAPPLLAMDAEAVITGPRGPAGSLRLVLSRGPPDGARARRDAGRGCGSGSGAAQRRQLPAPHAQAGAGHRRRRSRVPAHAVEWGLREGPRRPCRRGANAHPGHGGGAGAGGEARHPGGDRARRRARGRGSAADQRPAGLSRFPPSPGPGPDPPHAHHGPRARGA